MPENDPVEIAKLSMQAKIASLSSPRLQSPGLSPIKPKVKRERRQYTKHQLLEAVKLAAQIGVEAASKATGVGTWMIYKSAQDPRLGKLPKVKEVANDVFKEDYIKNPAMRTQVMAARMALYWHSQMKGVPGGKKQDCFFRAATRFRLNKNKFWSLYRTNKIDGVPYEP